MLAYRRPTEKTKLRNYFFDTFGPHAVAGSAVLGGIDQADNGPPEWGQGARAYGERVGSDFGIAMATTTTRYALAKGVPGRNTVLSLRVQGRISAVGSRDDFDGDGAPR